jgi:hypothetical protein
VSVGKVAILVPAALVMGMLLGSIGIANGTSKAAATHATWACPRGFEIRPCARAAPRSVTNRVWRGD